MRLVLVALLLASAAVAAPSIFVNPVCADTLSKIGAPTVPGGNFVQVFVTNLEPGETVTVTLHYFVRGTEIRQFKTVSANMHGAVAVFQVPHAASGFDAYL